MEIHSNSPKLYSMALTIKHVEKALHAIGYNQIPN